MNTRPAVLLATMALLVAACADDDSTTASSIEATATVVSTTEAVATPVASITTLVTAPTTLALAAPGPGDWPSYGRDAANSVHNRTERLLSPSNVADLSVKWRFDAPGGVTGTPVVVGGVVYFGDWDGWLRAVDAHTGVALWENRITERQITASVVATDRMVYAADLSGRLHAVDRATGTSLWSVLLDEQEGIAVFSSPALVDDMVITGIAESVLVDFRGNVVAVDAADGAERWRVYTDTGDDTSGHAVAVWSSAAVDQDRHMMFIGTGNTNRLIPAGTTTALPDSPFANGILAVDYETGDVAWVYRLLEEDRGMDFDVGASPNLFSIDGRDVVGVGGKSGDFAVVDRETGELVWQVNLTPGSAAGGVMSTAAVGDGVVYVSSNDGLFSGSVTFALDVRDGSVLWERGFDSPAFGALALANGVLYGATVGIGAGSAGVYALDASSGDVLWTAEVEGMIGGGLSISDGTLYVGSGFGLPPDLTPAGNGGVSAFSLP